MARILVAGVMRSGKTTVAEALGALAEVEVVEEPDNHLGRPSAFRVKRRLAQRYFPALAPAEDAPGYELLWRHGFGLCGAGHPRAARLRRRLARRLLWAASPDQVLAALSGGGDRLPWRLRAAETLAVPERPERRAAHVVVTANAPLSVEWVASRFADSTVIVTREPVAVLSSWAQLDWLGAEGHDMLDELDPEAARAAAQRLGIAIPPRGSPPLVRAAWLLGVLTRHLDEAVARNPGWRVVSYERLVEQPAGTLRELAGALGLPWREEALPTRDASPGAREPEAVREAPSAGDMRPAGELLEVFRARASGGGRSP